MSNAWLRPLPLLAILRGLTPDTAVATGTALVSAGFRILEVPLNSPQPLASITQLVTALDANITIGAGTVLDVRDVAAVATAGGRLIVMPHTDVKLIRATKEAGLLCVPGVATPTEAYTALAHGADALKLFPAEQLTPQVLKAWRAILPTSVPLLPVGGITTATMTPWIQAGASGFGIGSALYKPDFDLEHITMQAHAFIHAWQQATSCQADR